MEKEVWKDIAGYEGKYKISSLGRVRSLSRYRKSRGDLLALIKEKVLKPVDYFGYQKVTLRHNNESQNYRIHRLVATAFIPNVKNKPFINHKDGNKKNNSVDNLEWVTNQENISHAVKNGRHNLKGSRHPKSKLEEEEVLKIRELYERKVFTRTELGEMFGVTEGTISYIVKRMTWKHI
jgi:hypothetical protein